MLKIPFASIALIFFFNILFAQEKEKNPRYQIASEKKLDEQKNSDEDSVLVVLSERMSIRLSKSEYSQYLLNNDLEPIIEERLKRKKAHENKRSELYKE